MSPVGLRSLAVSVPRRVVDNEYWRRNHPGLVARAEQRIWMWTRPRTPGHHPFDIEMTPYLADPFRGARQRRVLSPDETALDLETDAARRALAAAALEPEDVDCLICSSFLPDSVGIGGAAFLARALGVRGAAWNLESACSSSLIALETATALIASGQAENVLIVTSCTYSRATRESDPIAWGVGDAATAMLVGPPAGGGEGVLGAHSVHTAESCDAVAYHLEPGAGGRLGLRMRTGRHAARRLRETSERTLRLCVDGALERAGVELDEIDHFVFNTPLAWYARFCARSLGVDPARTISTYPLYANVGPCLLGMNLLHLAHWRDVRPGQRLLLYSVGSVSSSAAVIVEWSDVGLGALPAGATPQLLEELESCAPPPVTLSAVA